MKSLVIAAVLACPVGLAGCTNLSSSSWGGGMGGKHRADATGVRTGYDVSYLTRAGQVYLAVASDATSGGGCRGGPPGGGILRAADGREVEWSCVTRDGVTGTVVVGGKEFRLEDGGVILVALRGGGTVVEQVAVDMNRFHGNTIEEGLGAMAATDERVARFLKDCDAPE